MSRPNFQNLQVYQLSEKLADEIWNVVQDWDFFAKDTVGKQIVRSALGQILRKEKEDTTIKTIDVLSKLREVR